MSVQQLSNKLDKMLHNPRHDAAAQRELDTLALEEAQATLTERIVACAPKWELHILAAEVRRLRRRLGLPDVQLLPHAAAAPDDCDCKLCRVRRWKWPSE